LNILGISSCLNNTQETRVTDDTLVVLIINIGRFVKTICSQDQPVKTYPQPMIDAIDQFTVYVSCQSSHPFGSSSGSSQLQKVENVARRLGKRKWLRRCQLEPGDRRIIVDCNDAIQLALHSLSVGLPRRCLIGPQITFFDRYASD